MSNRNQKRPKIGEKFKLEEEENPNDDSSKATFEISSQIIKIPYLKLFQLSRVVQAEFKQNAIFERLSGKLKETQQKNKIDDNIILTFFRLLNNEEVELNPEEIHHLFKLTDLFKIDSLKRSLLNHIQKHAKDVEFILGLKISQEANDDKDDENLFSAEMEKWLSENINECLRSEKLSKLSVSSIYRMIDKSFLDEMSCELLYRFISESIEDRHVMLKFVEVEKLSDETFSLFCDKYERDMKEQNNGYYDYLPNNINYIIQLRTKQQTLEKQIKTLEEKLKECEIKNKHQNDELTKINQGLKTQLNDAIKQKDDEISQLAKIKLQLENEKNKYLDQMKNGNEERNRYSFEIIKELLSRYGKINEFEVSGINQNIHQNILHYAVKSDNRYLVEYILSQNIIDINSKTILNQIF